MTTVNKRVPAQYANKSKARQWYDIIPGMSDQIRDASDQVRATYDLETQTGVQLDIIGTILNAPRGTQTDGEYLLFLRAAITRNNGDATIDNIIEALEYIVTSNVQFELQDFEDMSFGVSVLGTLTPFEIALINTSGIVPKPQGVLFRGIVDEINLTPVGALSSACGPITSQCSGFIS